MPNPVLDEHTAAHVAELFRAFSDTSRVRILSALIGGEMNVGALALAVGISESAVSKPRPPRTMDVDQIIQELRPKVSQVPGIMMFMQNLPSIRIGGQLTKSQYQFTLQSPDPEELYRRAEELEGKMRALPQLQDVTNDMQIKNPQVNLDIDRDKAADLGVDVTSIAEAINTVQRWFVEQTRLGIPVVSGGPVAIPAWNLFSPQVVGFVVFMVAIVAEMERIPFDLPEADAELVEGWTTELSGMRFGLVFGFKWLRMIAGAASRSPKLAGRCIQRPAKSRRKGPSNSHAYSSSMDVLASANVPSAIRRKSSVPARQCGKPRWRPRPPTCWRRGPNRPRP